MATKQEDVYCTLLMSDSYLPGAAVLAHSLRDAGTKKKLAVLVPEGSVSPQTVEALKELYDEVIPIAHIRNTVPANLYLMGRPDLVFTFSKIALWRLTQFRKIVYLDADVVALRAIDELFDLDVDFAAAPDIGWPDAFNSGVMVIKPNMGDYWGLETMAACGDSFDGADQGLLNQYYQHRNWHRLSFTYNCTPNAQYQWEPAYRYYKANISVVHFIGKNKPWNSDRLGPEGPGTYNELLAKWWTVWNKHMGRSPTGSKPTYSARKSQGEEPNTSNASPSAHSSPSLVITEPEQTFTPAETLSESGEGAQNVDVETVEPRQFMAPQMEWDATQSAPTPGSRPEAANFTHSTYEFNQSRGLFNAPRSYPEPPKDMYYKVPDSRPSAEPLKPIFPWEANPNRLPATRVFQDEAHPAMEVQSALPSSAHDFSTTHYDDLQLGGASASSPERVSSPPFADAFQQSNVNAWDKVPGINDYVRAIVGLQARRANSQVIYSGGESDEILADVQKKTKGRRESLIITDFPTSIERPSLPVTPAPRPVSHWGQDKSASELPQAEGVPDQAEWNPVEKLEQLSRNSLSGIEHLKNPDHPEPPRRALPEHSVPETENKKTTKSKVSFGSDGTADEEWVNPNLTSGETTAKSTQKSTTEDKPVFKELDFTAESIGAAANEAIAEDLLSPTEER